LLDLMLPLRSRAQGLFNERKIAQALRPLPLERISAPALIASVADDGYGTYPGARYTAEHVGSALHRLRPRRAHAGRARGRVQLRGAEVSRRTEAGATTDAPASQ
jgi:hypothetical protein